MSLLPVSNFVRPSGPASTPPLSGVVSASRVGLLTDTNTYRRYAGSFATSARFKGNLERNEKVILFEVGRRHAIANDMLRINMNNDARWTQTVRTNEVRRVELMALQKKWTNFSGTFSHMDLSFIGWQLAAAVAKYSVTGTLTCNEIRGGSPINVRAANTSADPVSAAVNSVFIPRNASILPAPGVFAALCAAANAGGACVFTDVLEVDNNNAPVIIEEEGIGLAVSCVQAMRVLMSIYEECGAGAKMAFAITKGIHRILTVVGHTDEGGYLRDALRTGGFVTPFGGIFCEGVEMYLGLPLPTAQNAVSIRTWVDGIALATAGAAALSDPLCSIGDQVFPTIFTSRRAEIVESGSRQEPTLADLRDLAFQIADSCGTFCEKYVEVLAKLFVVSGGVEDAATHLSTSFATLAKNYSSAAIDNLDPAAANRHLAMTCAAPWFWIEPTTLFGVGMETDAYNAGFGHLVSKHETLSVPAFDRVKIIEDRAGMYYVAHSWRTARCNGIIQHLLGNPLDGLANLIPTQFVRDKVILSGGHDMVSALREDGTDVGGYLWGRGQSPISAPAEMVYLGDSIGSRVISARIDNATLDVLDTHFPTADELMNMSITYSCSAPRDLESGRISQWERQVNRERSRAANALNRARMAVKTGYDAGGLEFIVGDFEPRFLDVDAPVVTTETMQLTAVDVPPTAVHRSRGVPARVINIDVPSRPQQQVSKIVRPGGQVVLPRAVAVAAMPGGRRVFTNVTTQASLAVAANSDVDVPIAGPPAAEEPAREVVDVADAAVAAPVDN